MEGRVGEEEIGGGGERRGPGGRKGEGEQEVRGGRVEVEGRGD